MPQQISSLLSRLTSAVRGFSIAQRTLAIIGLAVLVLGGIALSSAMNKTQYSPLFSNLAPEDASAIVDQLTADGVSYEITGGGGTIMVPTSQVYDLRLKAASAGLPGSSDGGYSLLDDMGMTSSEFQNKVTYQRALEGEFAKTISAMDGVKGATVKLALPEESVFVSEQADPTASVFLRTAAGTSLNTDQVQSIVNLVSSGVQGMKPADVAVIDASGKVLSTVGQGPTSGVAGQQTTDYEQRVGGSVQAMLDRVVGAGNAVVSVTAELDFDATQRTSTTHTATEGVPPLSESRSTEEYTGGSGTATGVLGPDNIQVPSGEDSDRDYKREDVVTNNAVNQTVEETITAPGSVRRQSVAVVVDQTAAAAINMQDLNAMVASAAGIDAERGDVVTVSRMTFDTSAAAAAQEALAAADAEAAAAKNAELIRTGAIAAGALLLVILVAAVLARRARKAKREAVDIGDLALLAQAPQLIEPPEAAVEIPALPAPDLDPETLDMARKRADLAAMADEQPGEVADVLRAWLDDKQSA